MWWSGQFIVDALDNLNLRACLVIQHKKKYMTNLLTYTSDKRTIATSLAILKPLIGRPEETYRVLHCTVLLWTHTEICAAVLYIGSTIAHGNAGCTNIVYRAAKPFVAILASIKLLETSAFEKCMHIVVGKAAAVRAHGAEGELGAVWQTTGVQLFVDAGFHIAVGKAYL